MEHSRFQSKLKTSNVSTAQSSENIKIGSTSEQNVQLAGQLPIAYLQRTIGNRAVGQMLQQGGARPPLQAKRAPIPNNASGLIQMRKIPVNNPQDGTLEKFETEEYTRDFLERVQEFLNFYDEKAAAELNDALENGEYKKGEEDEVDINYFPLQAELDHFEEVVLPEMEMAEKRIEDNKGPQSLTKFQGNVFERTTLADSATEETKAISTNAFQSNFSGIDFLTNFPGGPFGQDKSHISGDMAAKVAAYKREYKNRRKHARKMLAKMLNPKTKTTQNMLEALQEAFNFDDEGVVKKVVKKLEKIHKNNEDMDETDDGEYITAEDLDDDLINLVADNMLFTCPSDVYEHLPSRIQEHFLPSTVSSHQLSVINERSLELGLTKPAKPKGSRDPDPDYDGTD